MAEFCLDCLNKINETKDSKRKYVLSKDLDLCEECGELKPVIIMERRAYYVRKLRYFLLPFYFIWRLLMLPYLIFKYNKSKSKRN